MKTGERSSKINTWEYVYQGLKSTSFDVFSENVNTFTRIWLFFKKKYIVNLRKTCCFGKHGQLRTCSYAKIFYVINVNVYNLKLWYNVSQVQEIVNCAILFKHLLHENKAVARFTSCHGTTQKMSSTTLDMKNACKKQNFLKKISQKIKCSISISLSP